MKKRINVSEEVYRGLEMCSYSTLSRVDKRGNNAFMEFNKGPALTFGSLVDCVCLTPELYIDKFYLEQPGPTASSKELADKLIELGIKLDSSEIKEGTDTAKELLIIMDNLKLWIKNSDTVRLNKLDKDFINYVNNQIDNIDKTPITYEDLEKASQVKTVLDTHLLTNHIFHPEELGNETMFQVQGMSEIDGIPYKFMCDIVYIDHENKEIRPYDLKTGSSPLTYFETSIIEYRYDIQHYLYTKGINDIKNELVDNSEEYTVIPLEFIYFDKANLEVPVIYKISPDYDIFNGYETKFGRKMTGIKDLLEDYVFYMKNGTQLPKRWVENNGIINAEL